MALSEHFNGMDHTMTLCTHCIIHSVVSCWDVVLTALAMLKGMVIYHVEKRNVFLQLIYILTYMTYMCCTGTYSANKW